MLNAPMGANAYTPSSESLTGWWRIDGTEYNGAPWTGTASAGVSGSRSLILSSEPHAANVGATLNSFATGDFATNRSLIDNTRLLSTYLNAAAYTISFLLFPRNAVAPSANVYADAPIVTDNGGNFGVTFTTSGIRAWHYDGSYHGTTFTACPADMWSLIDVTYDGTNIKTRRNGGTWASAAYGNVQGLGSVNLRIGRSPFAYGDFLLAELMIADFAVADGTLDSRLDYVNSRYALSL